MGLGALECKIEIWSYGVWYLKGKHECQCVAVAPLWAVINHKSNKPPKIMSQDTELYQWEQLKQCMLHSQPGWEMQDPPPKLPKTQGKHTWTQHAWAWWSVLLNVQMMFVAIPRISRRSKCKVQKKHWQLHRKS